MTGQDHIFLLKPDQKIDELKIMALGYFVSQAESMKSSLYHKILLVRTGKVLSEDKSVIQEGLKNNDELLLLKKRLPMMKFDTKESPSTSSKREKEDRRKVPTEDIINRVTMTLPKPSQDKPNNAASGTSVDVELRKILISLIEASQKILSLNAEASKIFKQAEEMLNEPTTPSQPDVNPDVLKQLTDMGFPENRARKAMILNGMMFSAAMDWLIQHESDADIDEPLPGQTPSTPSRLKEEEGATGGSDSPQGNSSPSTTKASPNILQSLRAFRKREFKPNPMALKHLVEMGFDEKDAFEALCIARNNQDEACEWLLGDRKTRPEETEEGLDPNGAIYKAIMANPQVQLGLNNPRCLLAFLQLLESPYSLQQLLSDPETGPLLFQISRIYHAEKHADT
ncbi:hypothetical protein FSP39_009507 [Pinctada imbricata]|uniref:UBA domain-containing protein n=1 Tax=Pinctada imbricata TaxID=66713 RepID=A0AA88XLS3_PINIB|nr:hypothetical protein FSP39_009507 [Pinctada imbricata]